MRVERLLPYLVRFQHTSGSVPLYALGWAANAIGSFKFHHVSGLGDGENPRPIRNVEVRARLQSASPALTDYYFPILSLSEEEQRLLQLEEEKIRRKLSAGIRVPF